MIDWCGGNKLYMILWCGRNKSDGLHNKGSYHKWQYKVIFRIKILCIQPWKRMATSASLCEGPIFYYYLLSYARVMVIFTFPFYILSFGKHHVVRKDLGTYIQLDMGGMSYYCWHHPWSEYMRGETLSPYLSMCPVETFCSCVCGEC